MKKDRLISCDNHKMEFVLNGNTYILSREAVESELKIYWFMGSLYKRVIDAVSSKMDWLSNYKK